MNYQSIKNSLEVLTKRIFSPEFRKERKEFLKTRDWEYFTIKGLRDDFFDYEADRKEKDLIEKERCFGLKHDNSYSDKSVVFITLG